jgi:hypothetical protein
MEETMTLLAHELEVNTRAAELAKKAKYSHAEVANLREMFEVMDEDESEYSVECIVYPYLTHLIHTPHTPRLPGHSISSDELFSAVVRSGVNISNKVFEQLMYTIHGTHHTLSVLRS